MATKTISKQQAQKELEKAEKRAEQLREIIKKADEPKKPKLVGSYEEACKVKKRKALKLADFKMFPSDEREYYFAFHQLTVIHSVLNGTWAPDYNNDNELKWFPRFDMRGSRFVFGYSNYNCDDVYSTVGAAIVLQNEALSDYSGTTFKAIWQAYLKPKHMFAAKHKK